MCTCGYLVTTLTYVGTTKYKTPNDLGNYIKRLLTNDSLYEYHTTNFDSQKVINFLDSHCHSKDDYMCQVCRHAYKLKMDSFHNGSRHCNCILHVLTARFTIYLSGLFNH